MENRSIMGIGCRGCPPIIGNVFSKVAIQRGRRRRSVKIMSSARITAKSLYKNILRAHERYLPHEMKQLGDAYVKAEVRILLSLLSPLL